MLRVLPIMVRSIGLAHHRNTYLITFTSTEMHDHALLIIGQLRRWLALWGLYHNVFRQEVSLQCSRKQVCMVHLIVAITGAHRAPDLPLAAAVALWPCRARGSLCKSRTSRKTISRFTLLDRWQL